MRLQHERGKNPHPDAFFSGRRPDSNAGLSQPPRHPNYLRVLPPPVPTPRGPVPGTGAAAPPSAALRRTPAIMNDRIETESITTSFIHPTPCLRSDRSLPRNKEAADKLVPRVAGGPAGLADLRCSSVALRHRLSAALLLAALRVLPSATARHADPVRGNPRTVRSAVGRWTRVKRRRNKHLGDFPTLPSKGGKAVRRRHMFSGFRYKVAPAAGCSLAGPCARCGFEPGPPTRVALEGTEAPSGKCEYAPMSQDSI